MNTNKKTLGNPKKLALCGLFVALIAVGTFIKIPIPVVPFTLQFLFTMMAGLFLGPTAGAVCVLVYMLLGLVGLPIFAEGGGLFYVLKPSFGYIIGFVVGTYVTGFMVKRSKKLTYPSVLIANFAGLFFVYLLGMVYYYIISNYVIMTPIGLWPLFLYCFILAVPGDIALCLLGAYLGTRLIPVTRRLYGTP
ncbi:MAG: biotin transporter BioY [Lachnospiraceae bacterium]|nr:biotin transporter BioY [Candidatus Merdinaster equi]